MRYTPKKRKEIVEDEYPPIPPTLEETELALIAIDQDMNECQQQINMAQQQLAIDSAKRAFYQGVAQTYKSLALDEMGD